MTNDVRLLRAHECAPIIGTSVSALYRMARYNIVPCRRTGLRGRGIRFSAQEVLRALENRPAWTRSDHSLSRNMAAKEGKP
jgi:predicted DNA-binding transcriptional regulator AlpA